MLVIRVALALTDRLSFRVCLLYLQRYSCSCCFPPAHGLLTVVHGLAAFLMRLLGPMITCAPLLTLAGGYRLPTRSVRCSPSFPPPFRLCWKFHPRSIHTTRPRTLSCNGCATCWAPRKLLFYVSSTPPPQPTCVACSLHPSACHFPLAPKMANTRNKSVLTPHRTRLAMSCSTQSSHSAGRTRPDYPVRGGLPLDTAASWAVRSHLGMSRQQWHSQ